MNNDDYHEIMGISEDITEFPKVSLLVHILLIILIFLACMIIIFAIVGSWYIFSENRFHQTRKYGMKTYVNIDIELEVDFDEQKSQLITRYEPGYPAAIEINSLLFEGEELPETMVDGIMEIYEKNIKKACWQELEG